ncbi:EscR/YscR/HrcR family type III secretion system export apparatus protein [Dyella mobilis]|uniref:EscR/YscR/HrcR family type III secretion system export apparatus protein n=1 Tax=Dyella mobilis TaxID=1849582 RepID=A0ABS2KBD1_9GAMM|nr:EscR/YscR/HrcR family type III secretion system export apparatus protein [Dyella mobilis]MBM7128491.1 EscR/YscR/HrcR family type III secretion system export apparatus protein [Dyella mobilis]GLQ99608.1 EscR/YscR/HrcR family type III secretion system export apparatus protein [Dyella mobilis]
MSYQGLDPWLYIIATFSIGMLPLGAVMMTSFTKISIVLALLRNSLGVQQAPSNLALAGIASAVTMLVMAPVMHQINAGVDLEGILTGQSRPSLAELVDAVKPPIVDFMTKQVDPQELESLAKTVAKRMPDDVEAPSGLSVLVPAFVISEVTAAFKIGMFLAIGFAVVDLITANLLMAMGMTMFPPTTVSIPLKLLVFVTTAGFSRTLHGLIDSYNV